MRPMVVLASKLGASSPRRRPPGMAAAVTREDEDEQQRQPPARRLWRCSCRPQMWASGILTTPTNLAIVNSLSEDVATAALGNGPYVRGSGFHIAAKIPAPMSSVAAWGKGLNFYITPLSRYCEPLNIQRNYPEIWIYISFLKIY